MQRKEAGMNATVTDQDREEVLSELERYYSDKAAAVAAKRAGHSKAKHSQKLCVDGTVNVRIDPTRKELVVSWGK
jgi:hypothetical protein